MSVYIPIPKYCRSRGYIRDTYLTGLNMVGGRLFFDEAVICFDNEMNNASMKVGESKLVEICFDYTRRVPC